MKVKNKRKGYVSVTVKGRLLSFLPEETLELEEDEARYLISNYPDDFREVKPSKPGKESKPKSKSRRGRRRK